MRDLSRPVGALNPARVARLRAKLESLREDDDDDDDGDDDGERSGRSITGKGKGKSRGMGRGGSPTRRQGGGGGGTGHGSATRTGTGTMTGVSPGGALHRHGLYQSHYSNQSYVIFFLARLMPEHMIRLQSGSFDAADRMFKGVGEAWQSVTSMNEMDVKELTPEFYEVGAAGRFLVNSRGVRFGELADGSSISDARLPPWALDASDFVLQCRRALEDPVCCKAMHRWIDLIFGSRQRGPAADTADNLFQPDSYEGSIDIDRISDPSRRSQAEAVLAEFGQTPSQLFLSDHPEWVGPQLGGTVGPPGRSESGAGARSEAEGGT